MNSPPHTLTSATAADPTERTGCVRLRSALASLDPDARLATLAASLRVCSESEAERFGRELLDFDGSSLADAALRAIAAAWDRLPPLVRTAADSLARGRWAEIGSGLEADTDLHTRISWAGLIGQQRVWKAAPVLAAMVADAPPAVVLRAAESLGLLGAAAASGLTPAGSFGDVALAVADAAAAPAGIRHKSLLRALLMLAATPRGIAAMGESFRRTLDDHGHPLHLAMRALIRRDEPGETWVRAAAWNCLTLAQWSSACLDRLSQQAGAAEHAAVLENTNLALNPRRAAAAAMLGVPSRLKRSAGRIPRDADVSGLSPSARAALPAWLRLVHAPGPAAARAHKRLLTDESLRVRYLLIREAVSAPDFDLLLSLCNDPDARIARSAVLELLAWRGATPEQAARARACLERLRSGPHEQVRTIAAAALDHRGTTGVGAILTLRRRSRRESCSQIGDLCQAIQGPAPDRGIRAALAARRLGLAPAIVPSLAAVVDRASPHSPPDEARLAATCAAALGDSDDPAAAAAIGRCLASPDPRVRANAVEAFVRQARRAAPARAAAGPGWERVMELKSDPHHRVRANVLRAWLDFAGDERRIAARGVSLLADMLGDPREMHRVAGLWLAERLAVREDAAADAVVGLGERIRAMLAHDPSEAVRERAVRVAARLAARTQEQWSPSDAEFAHAEVAL